ncbi:MAG: ABC transporter substrate-binding protein [Proteobacteria bacterium]|nr:ABC transporter substrate-binding protein [Pseudomonadota bacterium]MDA1324013.1 ABC transporter substrate-binding protein [Pseudomonadota bacterium]
MTMNRRIFGSNLFPAVAVIALLALGGTGTAVAGNGADDFVRSIGQQAINSLTGKELSDDQRQAGFRAILKRNFELPLVARFTLGRFWRQASEPQRKEFVGLFEDYLVQIYAALFRDYNGESFTVGKVREINKSDVAVKSAVTLNDGQKIEIYWRVRGKDDPKIIDVIVEGVSMVITQRDEFSSIMNQSGGKLDGLLTALRKKTGKTPAL